MGRRCYRCNKGNHLANTCPQKNAKCAKCGIVGDITLACRSGNRRNKYQDCKYVLTEQPDNREQQITEIKETSCHGEEEDFNVYNIHLWAKDPYLINLEVNDRTATFKIDTGSGLTSG